LNATGKASKADLKKAEASQALNRAQLQRVKTNKLKKNNANAAISAVPSLKISFKPAELSKTTEKGVAAQVQSHLPMPL
jgi:hypothetical protein